MPVTLSPGALAAVSGLVTHLVTAVTKCDQWVSSLQVGVAELGRRAWLRAMSPQGGGGSNPPSDTENLSLRGRPAARVDLLPLSRLRNDLRQIEHRLMQRHCVVVVLVVIRLVGLENETRTFEQQHEVRW